MKKKAKKSDKGYTVKERIAADKARFVAEFPRQLANVSATCQAIGISRKTFYEWKNGDHAFASALAAAREEAHEIVENKLALLIERLHPTAVIFYLKTQCREKWGEHVTVAPAPEWQLSERIRNMDPEQRKRLAAAANAAGLRLAK